MDLQSRLKSRDGVSEVTAAVLTIAVTLIAGAALFGYVNGEAATNEEKIGAAASNNANFLAEKFVIVDMNFSSSAVTIWLYNNGQVNLFISQVSVYDSSRGTCNTSSCFDLTYTNSPVLPNPPQYPNAASCSYLPSQANYNGGPLDSPPVSSVDLAQKGQVFKLTLYLPLSCGISYGAGTTYYVEVLGLYGNVVSDFAVIP